MPARKIQKQEATSLESAVQQINEYTEECQSRVHEKADHFFNARRFLEMKKEQVLKDYLFQTMNILYAPFYVLARDVAFWLDELGYSGPQKWVQILPANWQTHMQKEYETFLREEIFEIPDQKNAHFRAEVDEALKEFSSRRTEKTDLNMSGVSVVFGFFFFRKHNFSLTKLTESWAQELASWQHSSNFALGEGLGGVFYSMFPPEPSFWHLLLTGVAVLLLFGFIVQLTMAAVFLVQIRTGLYRNRMGALIERVRERLLMESIKHH